MSDPTVPNKKARLKQDNEDDPKYEFELNGIVMNGQGLVSVKCSAAYLPQPLQDQLRTYFNDAIKTRTDRYQKVIDRLKSVYNLKWIKSDRPEYIESGDVKVEHSYDDWKYDHGKGPTPRPYYGNCRICKAAGSYGYECQPCTQRSPKPQETPKFGWFIVKDHLVLNPTMVAILHEADIAKKDIKLDSPPGFEWRKNKTVEQIYYDVPRWAPQGRMNEKKVRYKPSLISLEDWDVQVFEEY